MLHPGKAGGAGKAYRPRKCIHPFPCPSSRRVKTGLLSLSCLANPASGGSVSRGHFWEDPSSLIPAHLPFLMSQSGILLLLLPHRGLCRWLLPLQMVHPLERLLWLSLGLLPLSKRWFQMGCLSDPALNHPFYLLARYRRDSKWLVTWVLASGLRSLTLAGDAQPSGVF